MKTQSAHSKVRGRPFIWTISAMLALLIAASAATVLAQSNKPAAPTGFSVSAGDEGEVVASWDAHSGANLKDYRLQWRPDGGAFKTLQDMSVNALTTDTNHTVTGLTAGNSYDFRLRARFTVGKQSHWTQVLAAQAGTPSAQDQAGSQGSNQQRSNHIETPQGLTVVVGSLHPYTITLVWDAPASADVSHINVRRTGGGLPDHNDTDPLTVGYAYGGLKPGQTYTFSVKFGTSSSASDFGPAAQVTYTTPAIPAITGLAIYEVEYDVVRWEWDEPTYTGLDDYGIKRRTKTPGLEPDVTTNIASTTELFIDTDYTPGVTYVYQIYHRFEDVEGNFHEGPKASLEVAVPQTLTISVSDAVGTEGGNLTFNINLSRTSTRLVSFTIRTRDGTGNTRATAPADYNTLGLNKTIPAGALSESFTVSTVDDDVYERYDETFQAVIDESSLVNVEPGRTVAVGTIRDDDPKPMVSFPNASRRVSEAAGTLNDALDFQVEGTNPRCPHGYSFDIHLSITGTATSGEDFDQVGTTFVISPCQSQLRIPLVIIDDTVFEYNEETIIFEILPGSEYQAGSPNGHATRTIIIDDNDPPPRLHVTAYPGTEGGQNQGNSGPDLANAVFKLELIGNVYDREITGTIDYIDGTAVSEEDYEIGEGTFIFSPDLPNPQYLKVPILDDDVFDGPNREHFQISLFVTNVTNRSPGVLFDTPYLVTNHIIDNDDPGEADYVADNVHTTGQIQVDESWINGNPVKGRIEFLDDFDWYRTELVAEHCYQVDVWGKTMADEGFADGLTLEDPELYGVYDSQGRYLSGTYDDDGRGDNRTARHTMWFTKSGTFYIAVSHEWNRYEDGGTFELSLIDMGPGGPNSKHCTKVKVD